MKALSLKPGTKNLHIVDIEEVHITKPNEVKIRILQVGICGTDKEEVAGGRAEAPPGKEELIIGHEMLGEVYEVGKEVTKVKKKDLVVLTVRRGCNQCKFCKEDRYDFCETGQYQERGIKQKQGYQTEYVVEEEKYVIPLCKEIASVAVLTEPTTVVEKAIEEATLIQKTRLKLTDFPKEKYVLVAGLGPIGLLATMVLSLKGAKILGLDLAEKTSLKVKIFEQLGGLYLQGEKHLQAYLSKENIFPDMILEAAGIAQLDFDLASLLGINGIYVLTGVPAEGPPLKVQGNALMKQLVLKNQVILGSVNASFENFHSAVEDLKKAEEKWGGLIRQIITSKIPYQDFAKAFEKKTEEEIKTVITWAEYE